MKKENVYFIFNLTIIPMNYMFNIKYIKIFNCYQELWKDFKVGIYRKIIGEEKPETKLIIQNLMQMKWRRHGYCGESIRNMSLKTSARD